MEIVDANILLRYLLGDSPEYQKLACDIIDNKTIFLLDEVLAEVVYVLEKVYGIQKSEITYSLKQLLLNKDIIGKDINILLNALDFYSAYNLDFVDSILLGYSQSKVNKIHTFDKKLNKLINKLNKINR